MNEVLTYAQKKMYEKKAEAELQLLIVEGDSNVADLQGFCAGVEVVKTAIDDNGFEVARLESHEQLDAVDELDEAVILEYSMDISRLELNPLWLGVGDYLKEEIAKKKDYLYESAKKGRDLAYVQGWKKAVEFINKTFDLIQARADAIRQQPTLDF